MELNLKAYAKINLALDVLRRRPDGYHDVKMIMQNISLYDELTFCVDDEEIKKYTDISAGKKNNGANKDNDKNSFVNYKITLTANSDKVPTDERNLIYKAVKLMFEQYNIDADIKIHLEKHIPVEAGMAGGSTDCAAAIKAVNELFSLGLSEKEMMDIGVKLGADVPFCIMARTALSEGIGEKLSPLEPLPSCYILVAKPPISVSTGMVYKNLKCDCLKSHPDVDGMIEELSKGSLTGVAERMDNVLETVTVVLHPEIEELKNIMKEKGALNSIMSGSGPTVFGLFDDKAKADLAKEFIISKGISNEVYVTEPV
ncbi:MAG: 4-(cytidine 5'-diphospho)-2-C-methyl-D-erythritol kinase [Lachnospiraceae bacterium]|nr:4-(cytidine 5'-diphospho)-2-C-methyl-D-erythritol kinase [Lachnospiraceae bacterium]